MGVYSLGLCGYNVWVNGNGESVTWQFVGTEREQKTHQAQIGFSASGRAFFRAGNRRIYLDECVRC